MRLRASEEVRTTSRVCKLSAWAPQRRTSADAFTGPHKTNTRQTQSAEARNSCPRPLGDVAAGRFLSGRRSAEQVAKQRPARSKSLQDAPCCQSERECVPTMFPRQ